MSRGEARSGSVRLYDSARKVMARIALDMLAQTDGTGPVLDVGCGPGLIANYLGERQPRVIHGIDVGPRSIAAARTARTERTHFSVYDGTRIPFPAAHFGAVLCLEVLEHVDSDRALVGEMARVLDRGGRLMVSTPNAVEASLADKPHHIRHYTASDLSSLVRGAGLRITSLTYRYHPIGFAVDRALLRLGRGRVATETHDDEALTVSSHQSRVMATVLGVYGRVVDPMISALVWREYRSRRHRSGGSIVLIAEKP